MAGASSETPPSSGAPRTDKPKRSRYRRPRKVNASTSNEPQNEPSKEGQPSKQSPRKEPHKNSGIETNDGESKAEPSERPSDKPESSKSPEESPENGRAKNRTRKKFQHKKTQRRTELDALRSSSSLKVFQIEPELYQLLLTPSDPEFPFQIPILSFDLHISRHYPNQGVPPWIEIKNAEIPLGNRANIENGFKTYEGTLLERVNLLDENLETLLTMPAATVIKMVRGSKREGGTGNKTGIAIRPDLANKNGEGNERGKELKGEKDENTVNDDGEPDIFGYSSSSDEDFAHSSDEEDAVDGGSAVGPKREGTEIVFPDIDMIGIALCEVMSLNIVFQCGRCKAAHTFHNLQSAEYGKQSKPRAELCGKCDMPLMVAFRKQFLHSMCNIAGYLDVEGGKVMDLLPSTYSAICESCNAVAPPFKNMDMGAKRMVICRNCHAKLFLKIELFDFVLLSTQTLGTEAKNTTRAKLGPTPTKQKLNLTGGEPLPNHGACQHYRKSTRWFRFTCCQRVFACDKCHDAEMQHPCELASRMICGYCSREQRFSPKCHYCQHDYVHKTTRFWEGGKGVRDRKLMSHKDKRKHKRDPLEKKNTFKNEVHFQGKSKPVKHS